MGIFAFDYVIIIEFLVEDISLGGPRVGVPFHFELTHTFIPIRTNDISERCGQIVKFGLAKCGILTNAEDSNNLLYINILKYSNNSTQFYIIQ